MNARLAALRQPHVLDRPRSHTPQFGDDSGVADSAVLISRDGDAIVVVVSPLISLMKDQRANRMTDDVTSAVTILD
jgi:hypothetical protein